MKTKTCGDCRWFDGEECNEHEHPVEDNEEACSYFQRKRAKPAAPTAKGWAESDYARRVASLALANGYVKLEPGQVVVNESTHSLAMHMAAKWAEHVAGNDRGVTFIRTSNMEARDE